MEYSMGGGGEWIGAISYLSRRAVVQLLELVDAAHACGHHRVNPSEIPS